MICLFVKTVSHVILDQNLPLHLLIFLFDRQLRFSYIQASTKRALVIFSIWILLSMNILKKGA
jgi:hypothetical protein